MSHNLLCQCGKCERMRKFQSFLHQLSTASKKEDCEEYISTVAATISTNTELMVPLEIKLSVTFNDTKHIIDLVAKEYLKRASTYVQHFIPVKAVADGNCLFNSIVSLDPDSNVSAVELRVRTVIELVKNKTHYINQCGIHVGPFAEALRRTCNNKNFSELYELVALTNVLHCEIQSVYPYIDYRAEMKIMNAIYKPIETLITNNSRVFIFWSSTEDETSTRARPGNRGIWNPNHFVPLLQQPGNYDVTSSRQTNTMPDTPQKTTVKNNREISVRSPEFSLPSVTRKQKISSETSFVIDNPLQALTHRDENDEEPLVHVNIGSIRRRLSREDESEDQREARLAYQSKKSALIRLRESEDERIARLMYFRKRRTIYKTNEKQMKKTVRLKSTQRHRFSTGSADKNQNILEKNKTMSISRQQRIFEKNQQTLLDQYKWPGAIPTQLKEHCLQDFCYQMSMSVLRQCVCMICNIRASASTMKKFSLDDILNSDKLSCHMDLLNIISKVSDVSENDETSSIFCSSSNVVFYKKGFDASTKTGNVCQECHSALIKDKIPMFSVANKMWIGDVPSVLQELTIAEQILISLYRHNSCVIKLHSPFHHHSTAQNALKGNVISFMHDVPNIVESLPLDVDDLSDTLKIIFVGAQIPDRVHLRKICAVSREKIRKSLLWLKSYNHMYRTIPINEMNINKLPDDDVPESIWLTIERSENTTSGESERTGYTEDPLTNAIIQGEPNVNNVFPLTTSAILDVNGTTVSSNDIGVHLLHKVKHCLKPTGDTLNITSDNAENEDVYVIPRSNMPVKDCYNLELFLGLFPTLFPYGYGVPYDSSRPVPIPLNQHIRYLLAYEDRRFEKHQSFMFVMFNVIQRRQACWNASLMATRPYFRDTATDLQTLTTEEIEAALISATKSTSFTISNPRINMLLRQIKTVGGKVMGSAYSRTALRTQIHALTFNQGLPSIFMTINPADIHSRVILYFAGINLDLDNILPETIPSTYERAQIIAQHPVASARFFNQLISSILHSMIEKGVLGPVKAYYGTVENQGRGSLHLHILIWLGHDLTPAQLKESVRDENFRNGLLAYLEDIIKQDLSDFTTDISEMNTVEQQQSSSSEHANVINSVSDDILIRNDSVQLEKDTSKLTPSIMPTPNPSMSNFALNFKKDIVQLVNNNNIHNHTATCYKYSKKHGNATCRMRMPRQIENDSSIDIESGEIKLKRLHETINNFNQYIISACRSNMDIKYIFSGSDAKALVYYITDYVTKSSLSFHDTFSLVLKAVRSFEKQNLDSDANSSVEEKSRKLVLRCYNTLASQQELSGAQVASYLMGWPDHYTTHEFANLYLIGIENYLQAALTEAQLEHHCQTEENDENYTETEEQFLLQPNETKTNYVYVNTRVDYQYRSASLDDVCLYDYVRFYRKKTIDTKDRKQLETQSTISDIELTQIRRGRVASERLTFQAGHPQVLSHLNIKRMEPVVPVLLGPSVPRRDRADIRERYCRSILTLFVPWRSVKDICDMDQKWEQAFEIRCVKITVESQKIIDNIQLLQECKSDRDEHLQQVIQAAQTEVVNDHRHINHVDSDSDDENTEIFDMLDAVDLSEFPTLQEPGTKAEQIYFSKIIHAVNRANRYANIQHSSMGSTKPLMNASNLNKHINIDRTYLVPATTDLIKLNNKWQCQIKDEKERKRNFSICAGTENNFKELYDTNETQMLRGIDLDALSNLNLDGEFLNFACTVPVTKIIIPNETTRNDVASKFTLNRNQKAAFMIITGHLDGLDTINETGKQNQLIMCVPGCGGTGKSQLIRAITAYFTETSRAHKLRKLAPTSVAASEIEGMTIHSFLGDGRNRKTKSKIMSRPGNTQLENTWRFVEYVILDEMSMVGLSLLARLNKLVAAAKHCDPMIAMGGVNIIFFGDYVQYSPVFDKPLYHDFAEVTNNGLKNRITIPTENEIQQKSARALILQINCVIVLEEQMRTKDLAYRALLNRVRDGEGTCEDWLLLRTRVMGIGLNISLNDPPWNEAPILVYRNEIRTELNNRAVLNKAYETGRTPTVVIATDTIKAKKTIDLPDLSKRLLALPDNKTEHLPGYLPLVPGMPVLLQENIACELGLSNGAQGIFHELVYSETLEQTTGVNERVFPVGTIFVRNAQYALVEIKKSKVGKLDSLDPLVVPIPVIDKTFEVDLAKLYADKGPILKMFNDKKLKTTIAVKRRGLPLVPAYSITTHKSQGQTLPKIVIDLNMPPGIVEIASAYVPLSRVQQLSDLVILQDFSVTALQVKPSKKQKAEMNRLGAIFEETKRRYPDYFT